MSRRIYIAGPYTLGDVAINIGKAIIAGDELFNYGFYPYIPHLNHFWHLVCPRHWNEWITQDLAFLVICDGLLRIPGESKGADMEVAKAKDLGIPVFYSSREIYEYNWKREN